MSHSTYKMAISSSQSELFFQLQMAAGYGGCHFQDTQLITAVQGSMIFRVSQRCLRGTQLNVVLVVHCGEALGNALLL